jgi:hypothetical protein
MEKIREVDRCVIRKMRVGPSSLPPSYSSSNNNPHQTDREYGSKPDQIPHPDSADLKTVE